MKNQSGFTMFELVLVIFWLASLGFSIWLVTLIVRALLKYIGI